MGNRARLSGRTFTPFQTNQIVVFLSPIKARCAQRRTFADLRLVTHRDPPDFAAGH